MRILRSFSLTASILLFSTAIFAQNPATTDPAVSGSDSGDVKMNNTWQNSLVPDGVIDWVKHDNVAPEWSRISENDVAWYQRVWRLVDVREKQNQAFIYKGDQFTGGGAFIEILNYLVKTGKIQAYSSLDDKFTTPLTKEEVNQKLGAGWDTSIQINPITQEETQVVTRSQFDITTITKYHIKEDYVFDRNLGRLVTRIVGIAPVKDVLNDDGSLRNTVELYWIYYPQARKELANYEVYNPTNMVRRMTWADYLDGNYFESTIYKTSINNPEGRFLPNNLEGLYEGQQIMYDLMDRESDMWER